MKQTNIPPDDDYQIRCRKLGHQIYFSYCRIENQGVPCTKALDCWHEHFPVEEFLRQELTSEEWQRAFEVPSKPKMHSLIELIEQAQQRTKKEQ